MSDVRGMVAGMDTKTKDRIATGFGAALTVAFVIGAGIMLAPLYNAGVDSPADGGTPSIVKEFRGVGEAPEPDPTLTPTPSPTPVVPAPVVEQPAPPPAPEPVKCPAGTVANAVDDYGNESNCQALGGDTGTQQCVGYDDAGNCTVWYKP